MMSTIAEKGNRVTTTVESAVESTKADGRSTKGQMRAAIFTGNEGVELTEAPIPTPGPEQVCVRLEGCGVCASNIPVWEGREWFDYPMAPGATGHEGWGVIDAVGTGVQGWSVGERVSMLSENAYAEYDVADADSLVRLPPELGEQPFPAEPLGCAMNIFARSGIEPGQTVAIVGIGFLGGLLTQLAQGAGASIIALSRRPIALEMAERMGADETIALDDHWQIIERVKTLTGGELCPVVIEATGKQWPLDLAAELTGERGRLIIAGYHQDGLRQVNMQLWNWRGLDVINAHERDPQRYVRGMERAVEAVVAERFTPEVLYTHSYGLSDLGEALAATRDRPPGFIKGLIRFQ